MNLAAEVELAGWNTLMTLPLGGCPTPQGQDAKHTTDSPANRDRDLLCSEVLRTLGPWSSPQGTDYKGPDTARVENRTGNRHAGDDLPTQASLTLAGWNTQMAGCEGMETYNAAGNNDYSRSVVSLAPWATPAANEFEPKDIDRMMERRQEILAQGINGNGFGLTLGMQAHLGTTTTSSPAETAKSVASALNPAMSRWLMGYPPGSEIPGWDTCSPGWKAWTIVQRMLDEYSRLHGVTESGD